MRPRPRYGNQGGHAPWAGGAMPPAQVGTSRLCLERHPDSVEVKNSDRQHGFAMLALARATSARGGCRLARRRPSARGLPRFSQPQARRRLKPRGTAVTCQPTFPGFPAVARSWRPLRASCKAEAPSEVMKGGRNRQLIPHSPDDTTILRVPALRSRQTAGFERLLLAIKTIYRCPNRSKGRSWPQNCRQSGEWEMSSLV